MVVRKWGFFKVFGALACALVIGFPEQQANAIGLNCMTLLGSRFSRIEGYYACVALNEALQEYEQCLESVLGSLFGCEDEYQNYLAALQNFRDVLEIEHDIN